MRISGQNLRTVLVHVLTWIGFAIYEQAIILALSPWKFNLLLVSLYYLLNILIFYLNSALLMPTLFSRRYYWRYVAATLASLAVFAVLRNALALLPDGSGVASPPNPYWQQLLLSGYRGSFFLFTSIGYWFARRAVDLEVQKREHEQQLRSAESSLIEAKLAFLKGQINPHFLFNSLNFLYAQVYPLSQNAAKGILLLSDTMRYALHEDHTGKVMLTQEVKHLHNYISINQLRFNNQLHVDFDVQGNIQFAMILPLVLITFVENCFKHGELGDAATPLIISLNVVQNRLTFRTHNKKRNGPKEQSTNIGLANTRQRLDLVYKNRYALQLDDGPVYYNCNLTIDL